MFVILFVLLLLILSYISLIIRPAKQSGREERDIFPLLQWQINKYNKSTQNIQEFNNYLGIKQQSKIQIGSQGIYFKI